MTSQADPASVAHHRKHLFVLDSDAALRDERYAVTASTFLPESFAQIAALQPDLLIIDLRVHERLGWEMLEQLARDALTNHIPVIVTSTDPRLLARAEAQRERFDGDRWIAKPFEAEALLGDVQRLVGSA